MTCEPKRQNFHPHSSAVQPTETLDMKIRTRSLITILLVGVTLLTAVLWLAPVLVSIAGDVEDLKKLMAIPGWAPLAAIMARAIWLVPIVALGMWMVSLSERRSSRHHGKGTMCLIGTLALSVSPSPTPPTDPLGTCVLPQSTLSDLVRTPRYTRHSACARIASNRNWWCESAARSYDMNGSFDNMYMGLCSFNNWLLNVCERRAMRSLTSDSTLTCRFHETSGGGDEDDDGRVDGYWTCTLSLAD